MAKRLGKRTIAFQQPPAIMASAALVGEKEGQGPLGQFFDVVSSAKKAGNSQKAKCKNRPLHLPSKRPGYK